MITKSRYQVELAKDELDLNFPQTFLRVAKRCEKSLNQTFPGSRKAQLGDCCAAAFQTPTQIRSSFSSDILENFHLKSENREVK